MIRDLFNPEPTTWGLRGDPYLWREMQAKLKSKSWKDSDSLLLDLVSTYKEITGKDIQQNDHFFVEKFSHGGMSSGFVSPEFWRNNAFPLILERYTGVLSHWAELITRLPRC